MQRLLACFCVRACLRNWSMACASHHYGIHSPNLEGQGLALAHVHHRFRCLRACSIMHSFLSYTVTTWYEDIAWWCVGVLLFWAILSHLDFTIFHLHLHNTLLQGPLASDAKPLGWHARTMTSAPLKGSPPRSGGVSAKSPGHRGNRSRNLQRSYPLSSAPFQSQASALWHG